MTRALIRRRSWGSQADLVRRARRLFGAPRVYRWLRTRGVDITAVSDEGITGEWLAVAPTSSITIFYLHGGGYVACSAAIHRPITSAFARLIPARVFALDYRLAPEHPFPAALDDAERAYRWLLDSGTNPRCLIVAGDSAGGGLALATLLRIRDAGIRLPAGAILLSPWTDLAGSGKSLRENDGRCDMFRPENIDAFAMCYAPPDQWRNEHVSPVYADLRGLPPLHLQVGDGELLRDDSTRVHQAALAAGGSSELAMYDGVFHGWHMLDGVIPESREALQDAGRFARMVTAG